MEGKWKPVASVSVTVLRKRLEEYLDIAMEKGSVMITRYGKPLVVMLSEETYQELLALTSRIQQAEAVVRPEAEGEIVVVEVDLPDALLDKARFFAERAGQTLNDFIIQAVFELIQWLISEEEKKQPKEKPDHPAEIEDKADPDIQDTKTDR